MSVCGGGGAEGGAGSARSFKQASKQDKMVGRQGGGKKEREAV